jgi:protein-L-isoaspartate O-methyltransferase
MPPNTLAADQRTLITPVGRLVENPLSRTNDALALARTIGVAARIGVFGLLADRPAAGPELAHRLGVQSGPLSMMLDLLVDEGLLAVEHSVYELSVAGRHWLDPNSATGVETALSHTLDQWAWWADLDRILIGEAPTAVAPDEDDEGAWLRYTRADYEVARQVADDVVAAIGRPRSSGSVLELGGGHGWFAAALCRRDPFLRATVIDHAGSVAIGREIMWETEMDSVVTHQVADLRVADLGGPHDIVVCNPSALAFGQPQSWLLLERVRQALPVGGVIAIVTAAPTTPATELLACVRSGGRATTAAELPAQLMAAAFAPARVHDLAAGLRVHVATAV